MADKKYFIPFRIVIKLTMIYVMKKHNLILLLGTALALPVMNVCAEGIDTADTVKNTLGIEVPVESYSLQHIEGTTLTKAKDANFLNSLVGRIAGATIQPSSMGTGGGVKIEMRGVRSIRGNNNVLFVIDGVPFPQLSAEDFYSIYEGFGLSADGIASFNAEDIESVSVLSGTAASVVYGSDAANGVILITTKRGQKLRKPSITVSNTTTFAKPFVMPEFQHVYRSWKSDTKTPFDWNPSDFYRTGHTINNAVTVSGGTEVNQSYFSAMTQNAVGLLDNNSSNHYNLTFRNTTSLLDGRLKIDASLMYIRTKERNMLAQGDYFNPIVPVYLLPDVLQKKDEYSRFEQYDPDKGYAVQYWPYANWQNPFWIAKRDLFVNVKDRLRAGVGFQYALTEWLDVAAQVNYDKDKQVQTQELYASTRYLLKESSWGDTQYGYSSSGEYEKINADLSQTYADVAFHLQKSVGNFSFNASLGMVLRNRKYQYDLQGGSLVEPNVFSLDNLSSTNKESKESDLHDRSAALFASLQIGYKDFLYLYAGGRNEWQCFWQEGEKEHEDVFYPSVGVSFVPTSLSDHSDILSALKFRLAYAESGMSHQYYFPSSLWSNRNLSLLQGRVFGEKTKSYEGGFDLGMLSNKLNLSVTLYSTSTNSDIPMVTNKGKAEIQNQGVEISLRLNQPLESVLWSSNLTYTLNKNKIQDFPEVVNPTTGEWMKIDHVTLASYGQLAEERLVSGGAIGDIYVSTFQKDAAGNVILNAQTGLPKRSDTYQYAGNASPDYMIGWTNDFVWKGFELGFVLQGSFGGEGLSMAQSMLDQYGVSKATADARDQGGVWMAGKKIPASQYYSATSGLSGIGDCYIYDATNIRLAELTIGYTIPMYRWVNWMQHIKVSFVGRNLLMLYNKAPFDSMSAASMGNGMRGIDYFRLPSLRNMGFSVQLAF